MKLIRDLGLVYTAGDHLNLRVKPKLQTGVTLADWGGFTLTIREDPDFPRLTENDQLEADYLDPAAEGWPVVVTVAGTIDGDFVVFPTVMPLDAGEKRYVIDVVGTGGTLGRSNLYRPTWVSLTGNVTGL